MFACMQSRKVHEGEYVMKARNALRFVSAIGHIGAVVVMLGTL